VGLATVVVGVLLLAPDSLSIRVLGLDTWGVVLFRGLGTCVGYATLLALESSRRTGGARRTLSPRLIHIAVLAACGNVCFVLAIRHTAAAHALVIIASSPVFSALITRAVLGEAVARRTWLTASVVLAGVTAAVLSRPTHGDLVGDAAAIGGAISLAALFVTIRASPTGDLLPGLTLGGALTAAVAAPLALPVSLSAADVQIVVLYMSSLLSLGLVLAMRGPRYLSPPEVSLLMLGETVLGSACVWAFHGETPTPQTFAAGGVILSALVAHSIAMLREDARRPEAGRRARRQSSM
jgi:drug/metabolite transporter (DMT)-like permease